MNPSRFFMPNMALDNMMMRNAYMMPRNIGLFSRLANGFRSFNWTKLLNGANKTLNVMNQTIPLIRQTRPMINNVKSMLQLAKAFRNETGSNINKKNISHNYINKSSSTNHNSHIINNEYPTFFV